jgi:hypothetical protein
MFSGDAGLVLIRKESAMSNEYVYELGGFDTDRISMRAYVRIREGRVTVEDDSCGAGASDFYGKSDVDMYASVGPDEAREILKANGMDPGGWPSESLAVWLANRLTGNRMPITSFVDIAREAGVEAKVTVW